MRIDLEKCRTFLFVFTFMGIAHFFISAATTGWTTAFQVIIITSIGVVASAFSGILVLVVFHIITLLLLSSLRGMISIHRRL
jgi:hypothetical protein